MLVVRVIKELYKACSFFRAIVRFLTGNKVVGSFSNTTLLKNCRIKVQKGNSCTVNPADWTIKNVTIIVEGNNNVVKIDDNLLVESSMTIRVTGNDNYVELGEFCRFSTDNTNIVINGNNCTFITGKCCKFGGGVVSCRENGTSVIIGDRLDSQKGLSIDAMEGKKITISDRVLIAYNVEIRNTDGHSILDGDRKRTNVAQDTTIGKHVWIGQGVVIMKGSVIPDECVVGAHSVVTKAFYNSNALLVGVPAEIKKTNITWNEKRI